MLAFSAAMETKQRSTSGLLLIWAVLAAAILYGNHAAAVVRDIIQ